MRLPRNGLFIVRIGYSKIVKKTRASKGVLYGSGGGVCGLETSTGGGDRTATARERGFQIPIFESFRAMVFRELNLILN